MSLADAAEIVLRDADGGPMRYWDITEQALQRRLIAPRSDEPWTYMQRAMVRDTSRREARGEAPRFARLGGGHFRLNVVLDPEKVVAEWNGEVKMRLRDHLRAAEPTVLEHLVRDLAERMGYDEPVVTPPSRDGGVDVRAILTSGGLSEVHTAFQVRRHAKNVQVGAVRELRGALRAGERGVLVTTSGFTDSAEKEANAEGKPPIHLVNGETLVELMAEHGLGVTRRLVTILDIDEQLVSGRLPDAEAPPTGGTSADAAPERERFVLFRLPSAGRTHLEALLDLLSLVVTPAPVDSCVRALQQKFGTISREDVAIRHLRVLVALGFAEIQAGNMFLTPEGRNFMTTSDLRVLRSALLTRIYGAEELLGVLRGMEPMPAEVLPLLRDAGLSRITESQATQLVKWFMLSGLAHRAGQHLQLADRDH